MGITILDKTTCSICGKVIESDDEFIAFPPFVFNKKDPLLTISDSVVHYSCLNKNKLYYDAYVFLQGNKSAKGNKICTVSGAEIISPDDYFSLGFLTINPDNLLYKYNFLVFNKNAFHQWKELELFISIVKSEIKSGNWEGDILELLPAKR